MIVFAAVALLSGTGPLPVTVEASSTRAPVDGFVWSPARALLGATWCEGAEGPGIGETWTVTFPSPTRVRQVRATLLWGDRDRFRADGPVPRSPVTVEVVAGDAKPVVLVSGTNVEPVAASLPDVPVRSIALRIVTSAPHPGDHTCLENVELRPDTRGAALALAPGLDTKAIAALPKAFQKFRRAVETCDASVLGRDVRYPIRHESLDGLRATYPDAAALVAACRRDELETFIAKDIPDWSLEDAGVVHVSEASLQTDRHWFRLKREQDTWVLTALGHDGWE